jgi:hypothetical protein
MYILSGSRPPHRRPMLFAGKKSRAVTLGWTEGKACIT